MTTSNSNGKKRPDHRAYAVRPQGGNAGPRYTPIGVGFDNKNGGITVLTEALPLGGQVVLVPFGHDGKPAAIGYAAPARKPDFEASMVRGEGDSSWWTEIGAAYRHEGRIDLFLEVLPTNGRIVLSAPRENA